MKSLVQFIKETKSTNPYMEKDAYTMKQAEKSNKKLYKILQSDENLVKMAEIDKNIKFILMKNENVVCIRFYVTKERANAIKKAIAEIFDKEDMDREFRNRLWCAHPTKADIVSFYSIPTGEIFYDYEDADYAAGDEETKKRIDKKRRDAKIEHELEFQRRLRGDYEFNPRY